jgi:hypothetical protein
MSTAINNLGIPTKRKRLEDVCPTPGCGTPVRWKVMWDPDRGAMPPGVPICQGCAERDQETQVSTRYEDPIIRALDECGVNISEYGTISFDTWDDSHDLHLSAARRWMLGITGESGEGAGLYLHGSNGNGKTALAVACIRHLLESGERPGRIVFTRARRFLQDLTEAYKAGGAKSLIRRAEGVRLLVLDEFGKEPPTSHSASVLSEIIDNRRGGTILTSNHSLSELSVRYAHVDGMEHLVSRLGPKRFTHLEFTGPDRRFM